AVERLAGDRGAALGKQAHDRERREGFAAAGLDDGADDLTGVDVETHPVHGREPGFPGGVEGYGEVTNRKECGHVHLLDRGSRASRRDAPMSVNPSATMMIAMAG